MRRPPLDHAGSALLATLFATTAIVLVGTAFLMTTLTESRIARNEAHAAQARYAAEAGARAVKVWFERPGAAPGFPLDPGDVERDREIVDASDPYGTAPTAGGPQYKAGVDLDADGRDDLFRAPYRGGIRHELRGTEDAPDMRIEAEEVLVPLSRALFGDLRGLASGLEVRIRRIDVFAPPYLRLGGDWVRHGVGTIKVVAGIRRVHASAATERLAERTVRLVLNELPYVPTRLEPVHACGDAVLRGGVGVRWGALVATGSVFMPEGPSVPESLPRALPGLAGTDRLWTADPAWVAAFNASLDPAGSLADPWVRVVAGEEMAGAPSDDPQPWAGPPPPAPGQPPPWSCCDRSNLFQHQTWVACPTFDYATWKRVARSGFKGAHYYAWHPSGGFREDGTGPARSFQQIFADAGGQPGLRFFDTTDGREPNDADGDGDYDNLTPEIRVGGTWAARGFVFLNAERFLVSGLVDTMRETFRAPGEPAVASSDAWIDLVYPDDADAPFRPAGGGAWEARGPEVAALASFRGVLVTTGSLEARDGGTFYGSLVARSVLLDGSSGSATRFHRDASLDGAWPPAGWSLPRFAVTRFATH
jgi:hypothetical protein